MIVSGIANMFFCGQEKENLTLGGRVLCNLPEYECYSESDRCGVVAQITTINTLEHNHISVVVVALDNPLREKIAPVTRRISQDLVVDAARILLVKKHESDRILRNINKRPDLNNHDHALFCCKSCERIACKIDLIDFSGNLVCKSHFCPWDSVNHGPNVQEVAELYCRMLDIAERAKVGVLHPEAKALMFHGSFVRLLAKARNREADAGQDLLRFFFYLLLHENFIAELHIDPYYHAVTTTWRFDDLQQILVGEYFLPFFHSLGTLRELKQHLTIVDKERHNSISRFTVSPDVSLYIASTYSNKPLGELVSIQLRAGSGFSALWDKIESLNDPFSRDEFDIFICQDNEPLLYGEQHFCLPLQDVPASESQIVHCLGMSSIIDHCTLQLVKHQPVVSPPLSFCSLVGDFPHNKDLVRKVEELQIFFQGFRRIRGDGNCYYRAIMFSYVEQILSLAQPLRSELVNRFISILQTLTDQEPLIEYFRLYTSAAGEHRTVQDFLVDLTHRKSDIDLQLIVAAKALLTKFILENRHQEANGMRLEDAMLFTAHESNTLEGYCREYIEEMGTCAEGAFVNLGLLFTVLGCEGGLVMMDRRGDVPINFTFHEPPESFNQSLRVTVHLLFRPGHYDLLYSFREIKLEDLQKHFPYHSVSSNLSDPVVNRSGARSLLADRSGCQSNAPQSLSLRQALNVCGESMNELDEDPDFSVEDNLPSTKEMKTSADTLEMACKVRVKMNYASVRKVLSLPSRISFDEFWQKVKIAFELAPDQVAHVVRERDGQAIDTGTFEACLSEVVVDPTSNVWRIEDKFLEASTLNPLRPPLEISSSDVACAASMRNNVEVIRVFSVWDSSMDKKPVFIAPSPAIEDLPFSKKIKIMAKTLTEVLSNPSAKLKMPHNDVNVLEIDDLRLVIPSSHALVVLNLPFAWPAADSSSASTGLGDGMVTHQKLCLINLSMLHGMQAVEAELGKYFDRKLQLANAVVLDELFEPANREHWPPQELELDEVLEDIRVRVNHARVRKILSLPSRIGFDDFWQKVTLAFELAPGQVLRVERQRDGQTIDAGTFKACLSEAAVDPTSNIWDIVSCVSCDTIDRDVALTFAQW